MITRKIGKLIRGKATPYQIYAACILASLIAFVPGFQQAPGLLLFWLFLLLILNANLFLAGIVGLVVKILALLLAPVSFALGRVLLEGPTRGLFEAFVNAPVFAYFGFEFYLVVGGQLLGLILGLALGFAAARGLRGVRRKLAAMEKDSAAYQKWTANRWVKAGAFVFVGGVRGKQSYDELAARKVGNPVRVAGVVLVGAVVVLGVIASQFLQGAIITAAIRSGLEKANGATVDLEGADVDLTGGSLTLHGLAMADPENLQTNLFAAKTIDAKLSTTDLFRKRAAIDNIVVVGATQGEQRAVRGELIGPRPKTSESGKRSLPEMSSLDDVLQNAGAWKERLSTARQWIDRFSGSGKKDAESGEGGLTYEDILRERVRALGYANVRDDSLINKAPLLLIRHLEADEVRSAYLPGELLALRADNLSTQPNLVTEAPRISVTSASGKLKADFTLAGTGGAKLDFALKEIAVDKVASQLKSDGTPPVQGGTMDIAATGTLSPVDSDLPLSVTLHDTNVRIGGGNPTAIAELTVPIVVRGPFDNPAVKVDQSGLQNALVSAGKRELASKLEGKLGEKLGASGSKEGEGNNLQDAAKNLLGGFLKKKTSGDSTSEDKETAQETSQ